MVGSKFRVNLRSVRSSNIFLIDNELNQIALGWIKTNKYWTRPGTVCKLEFLSGWTKLLVIHGVPAGWSTQA